MRISNMITAVDLHACGEPGRVILAGVADVPGATMFEKKVYLETKADGLRKRMLREPRGYPAANCNLPPGSRAARATCACAGRRLLFRDKLFSRTWLRRAHPPLRQESRGRVRRRRVGPRR